MYEPHTAPPDGAMSPTPRLAPLSEEAWDARARGLLAPEARDTGNRIPNIFTTLVRHPDLYDRFMPFGGLLLRNGRLPGRIRELLILRTAHNTRAAYEWARHVPLAQRECITDADLERIAQGPEAPGWGDGEAELIRAADELHRSSRLSDATWDALAGRWGDADLIEIVMLVGQYHMVAFFLNSAGVEPDPGFYHTGMWNR
ncbi:carboxymuconolactone decarboxylase family protein [Streptomyces sp. NPDC056390]|uniref:carboxymuconolactone decarboxylase family protein n=1 Tax=Streptomyces sp. NPDC056390 TaxID=3345806 RepID=UPI0035DD2595